MSGYSPFSIKSVCGRTFTDKNDSLPGRSLRAIPNNLPPGYFQFWLHKPFLENVGMDQYLLYNTIFNGMNIHLPAILRFTRYQGFDPSPCGFQKRGSLFGSPIEVNRVAAAQVSG